MDRALRDALAGLARTGGPALRATRRLPGGEVGATALVDAGGRRYVAKVLPGDAQGRRPGVGDRRLGGLPAG